MLDACEDSVVGRYRHRQKDICAVKRELKITLYGAYGKGRDSASFKRLLRVQAIIKRIGYINCKLVCEYDGPYEDNPYLKSKYWLEQSDVNILLSFKEDTDRGGLCHEFDIICDESLEEKSPFAIQASNLDESILSTLTKGRIVEKGVKPIYFRDYRDLEKKLSGVLYDHLYKKMHQWL